MNNKKLKKLEESIGYEFENKDLLLTALTHKSYTYESSGRVDYDNEKLEFLGDSVLSLVVSDLIYKKNHDFSEGQLSKLRASLINEYSLNNIAQTLNLGDYLFLGKGEEQTGGRMKSSLLSNAYEAILAAIYMDKGFETAYKIIKEHFNESIFTISPTKLNRDYKSQVQERIHKIHKSNPNYRIVRKRGPDHQQVFEVELVVGKKRISMGKGSSKKEAEQDAAEKGLKILKKCDTE